MATYNFTVRAQDETGAFSDRDFAIQVRNNLVDRMLAINSSNAYASVDGVTWTERTGKGGKWCRNLLGKWIVCTSTYPDTDDYRSNCGTMYRLSEDTINWTEDLKFWLNNDAPVYENDVEVTPAGPLYHKYFYPTRDQFTVIDGKIITPAIVDDKLCIVYSNDGVEWYAYVSDQSGHSSNMMGISENALNLSTSQGSPHTLKSRHGLSNIILHNGKYTMLNNHTSNFYISDDLVTWETVSITNRSDLEMMASIQTYSSSNFRDNFWTIISVNNVLWMMGNSNYGYDSSTYRYTRVYNYIFYTTNLTDVNYSTNYRYYRNDSETGGISSNVWKYSYYSGSTSYSGSPINTEHRQIYYANGVIFAYCGKNIVTTKTLTDNTRQVTETDGNVVNTITGSCYFEGDIYYALKGTSTGHGVKKLTIGASEYRSASDVTALPNSITDITSV